MRYRVTNPKIIALRLKYFKQANKEWAEWWEHWECEFSSLHGLTNGLQEDTTTLGVGSGNEVLELLHRDGEYLNVAVAANEATEKQRK